MSSEKNRDLSTCPFSPCWYRETDSRLWSPGGTPNPSRFSSSCWWAISPPLLAEHQPALRGISADAPDLVRLLGPAGGERRPRRLSRLSRRAACSAHAPGQRPARRRALPMRRYGADLIILWPGLYYVLPRDMIEDVEDARATLEFSLVLSLWFVAFGFGGALVAYTTGSSMSAGLVCFFGGMPLAICCMFRPSRRPRNMKSISGAPSSSTGSTCSPVTGCRFRPPLRRRGPSGVSS